MEASEIIKYQTTESIVGGFICLAVLALIGMLALRAYRMYLANEKKHRDNDMREAYKLIRTNEKRIDQMEPLFAKFIEDLKKQLNMINEINLTLDSFSKSVHSTKDDE